MRLCSWIVIMAINLNEVFQKRHSRAQRAAFCQSWRSEKCLAWHSSSTGFTINKWFSISKQLWWQIEIENLRWRYQFILVIKVCCPHFSWSQFAISKMYLLNSDNAISWTNKPNLNFNSVNQACSRVPKTSNQMRAQKRF